MENTLNHARLRCVDDVLITSELASRPRRVPDYAGENRALTELAQVLASDPQDTLQKLAELVITLLQADSAGISVHDSESEVFRWQATAGAFAAHRGGTMPRHASPCGTVIERNTVLLFRDPGRFFPAFHGVEPFIHEGLLAPWTINGKVIGTVWAIAHTTERHFDAEDARLLHSLAAFAAAGHQLASSLEESREFGLELEMRVADRTRLLQQEVEQRRTAEETTRRLYELHARLATEDDLGAALDEILAAACEFTHTDRGCVQLLSADGQRLEIVSQHGYGPDSPFIAQFRYQGFAQGCDVARVERRRMIIEDTETVPALDGSAEGRAARADGIRATLSTPMISRKGETIGVLSTQFRQPHRPTDAELRLIDLLAWAGANFVERHQAEAALRESEARFRALADASPALIWQVDAQAQAIYLNQCYRRLTGMTPDALLGSRWHALLHPDDAHAFLGYLDRAVQERTAFRGRTRIRVEDGAWRWFETYAAPWYGTGEEYRGHIALSIDVTESLQAEAASQEADRRKDEFLAMLAHELRNPLAPIRAAAELLQMMKLDEDRIRQTSQIIGRQVQHMTSLVDDLLDMSRVTRGLVELDKGPLDVAGIIADAAEQVAPLIQARGHRLEMRLSTDAPLVCGDRKRLVQVVANILNNAAKYTPEGGCIVVNTSSSQEQVVIDVADNGVGMTPAMLARAFDLFAQADRSADRAQGGLGLGLALVKSLVELHHGTVKCESAGPGKGCTLTICLPRLSVQEQPQAPQAGDPHLPGAASLRILVVDDNPDAASMLAILLEMSGHQVVVEHDPYRALAAARKEQPQVCLLDIGLPGIDGHELARRLRAQPETAQAVLIAVTGYGQQQDREQTLAAGFDHHLLKPVDSGRLATILATIKQS